MAQEFWFFKRYTDQDDHKDPKCIKAWLPDSCPHCQHPISIRQNGSEATDGTLNDTCSHTRHYTLLWEIRIKDNQNVPVAQMEAPCKQCGRKNDLGIKKCWMCECENPC